ncbi:MAG: carbamoyltransferase HypF [Burkholderiaceae bacterium]|nr:carbamoyltransferase HypF [Burkholderiaceae bacterium]
MNDLAPPALERASARVRVRGLVQGVGFRPFVYRLATELALDGCVRNDGEGVQIDVTGSRAAIDALIERLRRDAPPLARVMQIEAQPLADIPARGFAIVESQHGVVTTGITPDAATCRDCLAELCDPADRRHRYAFINCTHCGPRFTITRALPYDRPQTSMARFAQCPACQREYDSVSDRRFHAQPNACPVCGPQLWLTAADGTRIDCDDVIAAAMARIARGEIVALKGLGGFHLVCDARNAAVVARLRERKHRDEKPFAIMAANAASLAEVAAVDADAAALLASVATPIVLLPKRTACDAQLTGVAPGLAELGAMLPTTPLHWLLFHEAVGRPAGLDWTAQPQALLLVMTSANPGGEPLVIDNAEAVARLGAAAGLADAFVMHDRDIVVRCDDSVVRVTHEPARPAFIRRARGYTPAPIELPRRGPPVLALGAYLKNTACITRNVGRGAQAFLSQHIGDLDSAASCEALEGAVAHLQAALELQPQAIAHDLHPDFFSTRLALRVAAELGVPAIGVQHHHAHIAAICAEHGVDAPVLGLALDGVGHGEDDALATGTIWGGELLRVDAAGFERLGHLRPLALPGGDRAAREPWRMAAAALHALGRGDQIAARFAAQPAAPMVAEMLARTLRSPLTTSAGRWFDAAAGLLGLRAVMAYEGQAAMLLEAVACAHGPVPIDPALIRIDGAMLNLLPLAARLADEPDPGRGAALFHATLAAALVEWVEQAAARTQLTTVAMGGGVFLNRILSRALAEQLTARGLTVLQACQAPANDGGLALGQAWAAMQRLEQGT